MATCDFISSRLFACRGAFGVVTEELAAQIHEARTLRHQAAEEAEALPAASASKLFQECQAHSPIEAIAEVRGGIQKGPHRAPGANPVRYLTVAHVHRNRILTDSPRYFEVSPEELERWCLLRGDVLIIEGNGSADQIGRTALFRGEIEDCVHQNHVSRIRPDQQRVSPEFLNSFLNSPAGQEGVQSQSRTSSGLRSLSVGRIKAIPVPVPPLAEQRRIVAELDALHAKVDALKRLQAETAAELAAFLPAILDRAFKGEL
ncbi:MAG: restriction endonuclease subunit S [Chloroflexi bacterium]|nr:restriction endonuclease subunit S [Chloroflexota bacterium]